MFEADFHSQGVSAGGVELEFVVVAKPMVSGAPSNRTHRRELGGGSVWGAREGGEGHGGHGTGGVLQDVATRQILTKHRALLLSLG